MKKDYLPVNNNHQALNKTQNREPEQLIASSSISKSLNPSKRATSCVNTHSFVVEWQMSEKR